MSLSIADASRYAWQMLNGFRIKLELSLEQRRREDIGPFLDLNAPLRVLDLANGRLRPQFLLLRASGHRVYGIDRINRPHRSWLDLGYSAARRIYRWKLGIPAKFTRTPNLVCGLVNPLAFGSNAFDLVTSVAAFEHFPDVSDVVAEIHRVLRTGGLIWVSIHLFTSPSGGHNLRWAEIPLAHVPRGVEPWDHLRRRRLPFPVVLNEWRRDEYLEVFGRHFEILRSYCAIEEGRNLLCPEITAELSQYAPEELTCGAYVIVARKS